MAPPIQDSRRSVTRQTTGEPVMPHVVGVDHLSLRVSDFAASKAFYGRLMPFLGFEVLDEYPEAIGRTNGRTRLWIGQSEPGRRKDHTIGDVGFHHYAFELET